MSLMCVKPTKDNFLLLLVYIMYVLRNNFSNRGYIVWIFWNFANISSFGFHFFQSHFWNFQPFIWLFFQGNSSGWKGLYKFISSRWTRMTSGEISDQGVAMIRDALVVAGETAGTLKVAEAQPELYLFHAPHNSKHWCTGLEKVTTKDYWRKFILKPLSFHKNKLTLTSVSLLILFEKCSLSSLKDVDWIWKRYLSVFSLFSSRSMIF